MMAPYYSDLMRERERAQGSLETWTWRRESRGCRREEWRDVEVKGVEREWWLRGSVAYKRGENEMSARGKRKDLWEWRRCDQEYVTRKKENIIGSRKIFAVKTRGKEWRES